MLNTFYHVTGTPAGETSVTLGEVAMILAVGGVYLVGLLRAKKSGGRVEIVRVISFALGVGLLATALLSPLSQAADHWLSAHMAQHTLLLLAPLAFLGARFGVKAVQAVPADKRWVVAKPIRWMNRRVTPSIAFLVVAVTVVFWHIPAVFEPAASIAWLHAFEHWTMLAASALYWGTVVANARSRPGSVLATLVSLLFLGGAIGALMTFSTRAWYPGYAQNAGSAWLVDQQLAGVIMWIPMGVVIMAVGAWVTANGLDRRISVYATSLAGREHPTEARSQE